jgi:hypothetical protein
MRRHVSRGALAVTAVMVGAISGGHRAEVPFRVGASAVVVRSASRRSGHRSGNSQHAPRAPLRRAGLDERSVPGCLLGLTLNVVVVRR